MAMRHLVFLVMVWASVVRSETFHFRAEDSQVFYTIRNHRIEFLIRHPFKVVRGQTSSFRGILVLNIMRLGFGVRLDAEVRVSDLELSNPRFSDMFLKVLRAERYRNIRVHSDMAEVLKFPTTEDPSFILRMKAEFQIAGWSSHQDIDLNCSVDGRVIRCGLKSGFRMTDFEIRPPSLLKIPAEEYVTVSGEMSFAPEK